MKTLTLKRKLTEHQGNALMAKFLDDSSYDVLLREDADVYNVEGELLLKFRKGVIPMETLKLGYDSFKDAIAITLMRKVASGKSEPHYRKSDGKQSNTRVGAPVYSSVVGYVDPSRKMPFCRKTSFTRDHFEQFNAALPFVEKVDDLYRELCPVHYERQIAIARGTNSNFRIGKTSFTTVTVNKNFRTAVHKDTGDLPGGFGNLCVYREGHYNGGYFCLPEYGVAVDMQNQDMLFVDVHKWHGNTPFHDCSPDYLRISFVMYYREYMINCKQPSEELKDVKTERGGFLKL